MSRLNEQIEVSYQFIKIIFYDKFFTAKDTTEATEVYIYNWSIYLIIRVFEII